MRAGWFAVPLLLLGASAQASPCTAEIDALAKRVNEQGRTAIAASSSGQNEAAARGGQGMAGAAGQASERAPEKSAEAGQGAEKAQAAKVALDEARTADGKGDEKACTDALARVRQNLDAAP